MFKRLYLLEFDKLFVTISWWDKLAEYKFNFVIPVCFLFSIAFLYSGIVGGAAFDVCDLDQL